MRILVELQTYLNIISDMEDIRLWTIGNCPKFNVHVSIGFAITIATMHKSCTVEYGDFV